MTPERADGGAHAAGDRLREPDVTLIRTFKGTNTEMGAGFIYGSFYVFDRQLGETYWHTHCGPYSTQEQAADWINAIRETR